jgi:Predicted hydrolase (metallo-beta-lactamase superfamily)
MQLAIFGYTQKKRTIIMSQISLTEQKILMPSIDKLKFIKNNSTSIEVLYPFSDITEQNSKSINNNSIVAKICIQDHCILIPGDIEVEAENELLNNCYNKLKSDVLICPHHGSKTSSTEKFIQAVNGKFVIISN